MRNDLEFLFLGGCHRSEEKKKALICAGVSEALVVTYNAHHRQQQKRYTRVMGFHVFLRVV